MQPVVWILALHQCNGLMVPVLNSPVLLFLHGLRVNTGINVFDLSFELKPRRFF